jgi:RNA polymerase subunit RPABC4/transcription elongation factor Spt4
MNSIQGQRLKKMMGFGLCFMGGFFLFIGILFGALFEEPGLYSLAIIGAVVILIGILMFRSVKGVSLFDLNLLSIKKDRRCMKCGRVIPWDAKLCPYCGENFESTITIDSARIDTRRSAIPEIPRNQEQLCKICGSVIKPGMEFCQYCGSEL